MPLLFGNFDGGSAPPAYPEPPPDIRALGTALRRAWATFARTGDPGWPAFDAVEQSTCRFDVDTTIVRYPEQASVGVWDWDHFGALEPGAV